MGTIAVGWALGAFGNYYGSMTFYFDLKTKQINEQPVLEYAWCNPQPFLNLAITNVGTLGLTVAAIYVNATVGNGLSNPYIGPGQSQVVRIMPGQNLCPASRAIQLITIVTTYGVSVT